jgi:hypothetical protein
MIIPTQKALPVKKQPSQLTDIHILDGIRTQFQQASVRRSTRQVARPLGSASVPINLSEIEPAVKQFVASP